jgi:hypothetical protein
MREPDTAADPEAGNAAPPASETGTESASHTAAPPGPRKRPPAETATGSPAGTAAGAQPPRTVVDRRDRGFLRRLFSRLATDAEDLDDADLQAAIPALGATPISRCRDREAVCILGTLRTVTFQPRAGVPAVQAELWDGTGAVTVVWLGRRRIAGIDPGRAIKVRGRITALGGQRVIYNPIYELRPGPTA